MALDLVRRSNLLVAVADTEGVREAWRHGADAITLDLEDGVPASRKVEARQLVQHAISLAALGGAEVFVRVNRPYLKADLEASVWPGLSGIALPYTESKEDVARAIELLLELEERRGLEAGSLQVIALIESALGVWNVRAIVRFSNRVTQIGLLEDRLASQMGISPHQEYDPFVYARGRFGIEATAQGVQPVGLAHPLAANPKELPADALFKEISDACNLGFKGVFCPYPSWVEPANRAFTPAPELVDYYRQVREVFAEGVAAGTAAVPFQGRMIDVPVDEWAKVVLRQAELCRARDEVKRLAMEQVSNQAQGISGR